MLVTAVGGQHAIIHRDIPRIGNVGYVLRSEGQPTLFHPGDSYDTVPDGIDIIAVPAYGPWAAMKETIDFVRAVGALEGFPIHDELLSDRGRTARFQPAQRDDDDSRRQSARRRHARVLSAGSTAVPARLRCFLVRPGSQDDATAGMPLPLLPRRGLPRCGGPPRPRR